MLLLGKSILLLGMSVLLLGESVLLLGKCAVASESALLLGWWVVAR